MSNLRVRLLGRFRARHDGETLNGLRGSKVQELFAYLLLYRHRSHPRESLAALLWENGSTAGSKKYLRQALWQLQSALHSGAGEDVLELESEWLGVSSRANLWLDVAELERAYRGSRGVPGRRLDDRQSEDLKKAVELYTGDLLEGCYEDWCLFERERLQNQYLVLLDKLMGYCQSHGEYESGLAYGTRILQLDHAQERAHRRMMRLHCLHGDRTAALRQYERCRRALDEELGVEPSAETAALCHRIRQDRFQTSEPAKVAGTEALQGAAEPLPAVLRGLRELSSHLEQLLHRVQQEVRSVERTLELRH